MQTEKRFGMSLALLAGALGLLLTACSQNGARGDTPSGRGGRGDKGDPPVAVKVGEVQRREIRRNVQVVGTLMPFEEVTVSSEVDGRVDKVLVDIGDYVRKGQTLLEISPEELQYQYDAKVAQLRQALAKLGMRDENSPLTPDDEVPDVQKAAADRQQAEQDYQRAKDLFDQALIPKQQLDAAEAKMQSSRANYQATLQQVQTTKASIDEYRADVELARKKLRDAQVKAPFDGWIKQRTVAPGQYLRVQAPVFVLVDVNPLRFTASVPDRVAPWIKAGNAVQLRVEAYPDRTFDGKISRIAPSSDEQNRTFTVEALIDNSQDLLKPGFFAKADLETGKVDSILTAPANAVSFAYGVYKIYAIKNGSIEMRDVQVGEHFGDEVELISGAREHDRIALTNLAKLKDGVKVSVGGGGQERSQRGEQEQHNEGAQGRAAPAGSQS